MAVVGFGIGELIKIAPNLYRIEVKQTTGKARLVTKFEKLIHEFLYLIFTTRGRIAANPSEGSLLAAAIGQYTVDPRNGADELSAFVLDQIVQVEQQILRRQAGQTTLSTEERLNRIEVLEIQVNAALAEAAVRLRIINANNQAVGIELTV